MPKIKQLSPHEAQKIAAGQVVDRPVNAVKELIENALDAQATQINIFIEDGGKKLMRIVDNGCGMIPEDAQLCFAKHATSKIERIDELESITTFGFRGEALASIAAVSRVTLITKETHAEQGTKVTITEDTATEAVACTAGTDISVRDLFYNVPARAKFLKKRETEWRQIVQLVHAFCLDYTSIHFKLFSEGKQILNCPPVEQVIARFTQIFNHATSTSMLTIDASRDDKRVSIAGAISNHQTFGYNRSGLFFFVNKRWITNHSLQRALLKGYQNVIPQGRYPTACIAITIDPQFVDINIHPRKEEVKFAHPRVVEQLIEQTVREALENNLSAQIKQEVKIAPAHASTTHASFNPFDFAHSIQPTFYSGQGQNNRVQQNQRILNSPQTEKNNFRSRPVHGTESAVLFSEKNINNQQTLATQQEETSHTIIGQLNKTYILIEQEDGLFLVDQHAAQERILYELFSSRFEQVPTIKLMFPQQVTLAKEDVQLIEPHLNIFHKNGIMVEPFGSDQLIITSTPVHIKNISLEELIKQVLGWITEFQHLDEKDFFKTINEKLHAQMACKAAVKAGDVLTHEQMQQLLHDLHTTPNRFTCPHGRPTGWLLSTHDIEKKFKRKA